LNASSQMPIVWSSCPRAAARSAGCGRALTSRSPFGHTPARHGTTELCALLKVK
jgi:hypothetical protein